MLLTLNIGLNQSQNFAPIDSFNSDFVIGYTVAAMQDVGFTCVSHKVKTVTHNGTEEDTLVIKFYNESTILLEKVDNALIAICDRFNQDCIAVYREQYGFFIGHLISNSMQSHNYGSFNPAYFHHA